LGLPYGSQYSSLQRIMEELEYANALMKQFRCPVIDVTNKAIEETAGIVLDYLAAERNGL